METQALTRNENKVTGVMAEIKERSLDLGIDFVKVGTFNNLNELVALMVEAYPWEEITWDEVYDILNNGYLEIDDEDIDELQIQGNALYVHLTDMSVMEYCEQLIYDTNTDNYLLGFSNTGWLCIDGAIDLETMTVGYFNADSGEYRPVFGLPVDDVELLENVIENYDLSTDCQYAVVQN